MSENMLLGFLHRHPGTEQRLLIDQNHCIVDIKDWEQARSEHSAWIDQQNEVDRLKAELGEMWDIVEILKAENERYKDILTYLGDCGEVVLKSLDEAKALSEDYCKEQKEEREELRKENAKLKAEKRKLMQQLSRFLDVLYLIIIFVACFVLWPFIVFAAVIALLANTVIYRRK